MYHRDHIVMTRSKNIQFTNILCGNPKMGENHVMFFLYQTMITFIKFMSTKSKEGRTP